MAQRHMDRLTSFDTSFLANERSNGHMAIGAVLVCRGSAPSHEDFLAQIRGRLHLLPRLRQRLVVPPLQLGRPFWSDDPDFDIAAHVRRVSLPPPGDDEQFRRLIARAIAPPLDRSRSLWELLLVDGLEGGRFGIVYRTHHALADGISAVDIGTLLFDVEPNSEPAREEVPWHPQVSPSKGDLATRTAAGLGTTVARLARWLLSALRHPRRAAKRAGDGAAGLWEVSWALTKPSPKVPLNVEIGPNRDFHWTRCSLEDFKRIKNALGGTVNDVSLAVTSGALRRWLEDRGVRTEGLELQALVPVSVRAENEHGELGNRLTAMRGPLPVGIADPVERLRFVSASMDALKSSKQPLGAEAIWGVNDWFRDFAPPWLLNLTSRLNFATRLFNLLVTNFPGPQIPIYILGRELVGVYPVGFLARGHALSIAIISYNGAVNFGLLSDPDAIEAVERIGQYASEGVEELLAAAGSAESGAQAGVVG
jgi:diacylglycerol O-acyltransferase / wax synthase